MKIFDTNFWNRLRWSLWSPGYDLLAGWLASRRQRSLAILDPQPGERVLLVGAGTGLDLPYLPAEVQLTATDLTPAMVRLLRARAARLGRTVEARVMDGQALEFPDGSFDAVVLHFIVAVIPDPRRCLTEAARVLRPGGRLVIADKFAPDNGPMPLLLRLADLPARVVATHLARRLGPLLAAARQDGADLKVIHDEPAGLGGLLRIVLLEKR